MYGSKLTIPTEIEVPTSTTSTYKKEKNNKFRANLDLLEKRKKQATMKEAKYNDNMMRY